MTSADDHNKILLGTFVEVSALASVSAVAAVTGTPLHSQRAHTVIVGLGPCFPAKAYGGTT